MRIERNETLMKKTIIAIVLVAWIAVSADPLTLQTLTVDTQHQSVCGVSLGMAKAQVKAELGKRNLNYSYAQQFNATVRAMVPDENTIAVHSTEDKIKYYIQIRNDKVAYLEIFFAGYSEQTAKSFASKLWKPTEGTSIEVVGQTVQITKD
jgi:hypothetical protein